MSRSVFDLYKAVFAEDIAQVKEIAHSGNVNTLIDHRATPFHMACFNGDIDMVEILLARGADLHARGPLEELGAHPLTGLDVARVRGHTELVERMERLLANDTLEARKALATEVVERRGLDITQGNEPVSVSAEESILAAERVYNAIVEGNHSAVWTNARAWNINVELHHYGTPFHLACFKGNRAIVDLLLSVGADLSKLARLQEFGEERPDQIAARMGHAALAQSLSSALAQR